MACQHDFARLDVHRYALCRRCQWIAAHCYFPGGIGTGIIRVKLTGRPILPNSLAGGDAQQLARRQRLSIISPVSVSQNRAVIGPGRPGDRPLARNRR